MASTKRPTIDLTSLLSGAAKALGERVGPLPNVLSKRSKTLRPRIADTKKTPSVCPYCAVGCAQLVYSRGNTILDIEGNPDSPINGGTLCPKGAATYRLPSTPTAGRRSSTARRTPTEWEDVPLDWAMERIAERYKETRDRTFVERDEQAGASARTTAIAILGGATLDNEENYLIKKLFTLPRAVVAVENQARI